MAVMNVNPTRMELSNLKKKLVTARRGHKLLKDKRDELMRQFMLLIRQNRELRIEVEAAIEAANKHMAEARSMTDSRVIETAFMLPKQRVELEIKQKNVMSVIIPEYVTHFKSSDKADIYPYGYLDTNGELDTAVRSLSDIFPKLIKLAEIEKSCQLIAAEIEKTRRRVNALEHVMIPRYEDTIHYITMKLDENERSTTTRLMKVKDMMIRESIEVKREAEQTAE